MAWMSADLSSVWTAHRGRFEIGASLHQQHGSEQLAEQRGCTEGSAHPRHSPGLGYLQVTVPTRHSKELEARGSAVSACCLCSMTSNDTSPS